MTFRWRAIEFWFRSFVIFKGIWTSIAKEPYILVIFQGGSRPHIPPTPSGSAHVMPHNNIHFVFFFRYSLLATAEKRFHRDGLNSLDYNVTWINNTSLFTHIMVDIGQPPS